MGKHHKRGKGKRESQLLEVERAQRNASADDAEGVGSVGDSGDEDDAEVLTDASLQPAVLSRSAAAEDKIQTDTGKSTTEVYPEFTFPHTNRTLMDFKTATVINGETFQRLAHGPSKKHPHGKPLISMDQLTTLLESIEPGPPVSSEFKERVAEPRSLDTMAQDELDAIHEQTLANVQFAQSIVEAKVMAHGYAARHDFTHFAARGLTPHEIHKAAFKAAVLLQTAFKARRVAIARAETIAEAQENAEAAHKISLSCRALLGIYCFIFSCVLLLLIGVSSSYGIYVQRFQKRDSLGSDYLIMGMSCFLVTMSLTGAVGAVRRTISWLRFFSFTLMLLVAMETSLIMVFSDSDNEESMAFKTDALAQITAEYCKTLTYMDKMAVAALTMNASAVSDDCGSVVSLEDEDDCTETTMSPAGVFDGSGSASVAYLTGMGICECALPDLGIAGSIKYDAECLSNWWDQNIDDVLFAFVILVVFEVLVSIFAWNVLDQDKPTDAKMQGDSADADTAEEPGESDNEVKGTRATNVVATPQQAEADRADNMGDATNDFLKQPEGGKAKLVTDTWYFEFMVCFSVLLAMYVLALDSPAAPPIDNDALVLRILEVFVTVFLTFELLLECIVTVWTLQSKAATAFFLNFWTIMDIFVLCVSWLYLYRPSQGVGVCRALRVLRPMRTVRIFEPVQIVGRCIANDAVVLRDVQLLTLISLFSCALIGLTCFHGALQYTCIDDFPSSNASLQGQVCGTVTRSSETNDFCMPGSVREREIMDRVTGLGGTEQAQILNCPITLTCNLGGGKSCIKLEPPRAIGDDTTGLRGFDNMKQALLTMVIHMSGDNGLQDVPFGLLDAGSANSYFIWPFFALTAVFLSLVILNLLLAVCVGAFAEVSRIMKEREAESERLERHGRLHEIMSGSPDGVQNVFNALAQELPRISDPFHGSSVTFIAMKNKEWSKDSSCCAGLRNRCHAIAMSAHFRPLCMTMVVAYTVVLLMYQDDMSVAFANGLKYAETVLVAFFLVEFAIQLLALGWKLYIKSQENCLDAIVLLLTVCGTVGTYLNYIKSKQMEYGMEGFDIEEYVSESQMRALRLGRVAQLLRSMYKNKSMFEVMSKVFQSWKAILGVTVFTCFTLSMVTIISMHVLGAGLGPGKSGCYKIASCDEYTGECSRGDYVPEYLMETSIGSYQEKCSQKLHEWVPAVPLTDYPRANFETFSTGLLSSLQVMLNDDWSMLMLWYMSNGSIKHWAFPYMSVAWMGLHGILYSMFVAVLLINFSVEETEKLPTQMLVYLKAVKSGKRRKGESYLLQAVAHDSGPTTVETPPATSIAKTLQTSYVPGEKNPKSLYIFTANNYLRLLCARFEDAPQTTRFIIFMITCSLAALSFEGTVYSWCLPEGDDKLYTALDAECPLLVDVNGADIVTPAEASANATGLSRSDLVQAGHVPWFESDTWYAKGHVVRNLCNCKRDGTRNFHYYFRLLEYGVIWCFIVEMIVKSICNGFLFPAGPTTPYMRKTQNRLNFIALLLLTDTYTDFLGLTDEDRQKRLVRGLVPMVALLQNDGINTVVKSFIKSLPGVMTVLMPILFSGMVFSVVGVEYFGGAFKRCVCPDTGEEVHGEMQCNGTLAAPVTTGADCVHRGYSWINPPGLGHFDDVASGMMTLWKLATSGYVELQNIAMDVKRTTYEVVQDQSGIHTSVTEYVGVRDNSPLSCWYFVCFHVVFNFFLLNLFIGVMSSSFSVETGKAIITNGQKKWMQAETMLRDFHPVFTAEEAFRPEHGRDSFVELRLPLFEIVQHRYFYRWSVSAVFLNVLLLCFEHYPVSDGVDTAIFVLNSLFVLWFLLEFILKLLAFGWSNYFSDGWLTFDAVIVVVSCTLRLGGLPSGMELLKVLRCFKLIVLVQSLETLIDLMHIVAASIFNATNVAVIYIVVLYIYATMGMRLFSECPFGDSINPNDNFRTFSSTARLLFQISCGQQYTGMLAELLAAEAHYINFETGLPFPVEEQQSEISIFLFFASYYFLSVFICLNLFIVSILDSFDVLSSVDQSISRNDMWGLTYAWADLTVGSHACPALTRSEAKDFTDNLRQMLMDKTERELRENISVKVDKVPDDVSFEELRSLFSAYGTIGEDGISIQKSNQPTIPTYAIVTFTGKSVKMDELMLGIREIRGHYVDVVEYKARGKFASGISMIKIPEDNATADCGTIRISVISCIIDENNRDDDMQPYCKVTSVAKHKHHGGADVAKYTRHVNLFSEGDDPSTPVLLASSPTSPTSSGLSPRARSAADDFTWKVGSAYFGETFRWHMNEHSKEFKFELLDLKELTHTAVIGSAVLPLEQIKKYRVEEETIHLKLTHSFKGGEGVVGTLTIKLHCLDKAYVPIFQFLGDYTLENSQFKDNTSCGIHGWIYHKKSGEHLAKWQRRWMYICQFPEPCLKMYEGISDETHLEKLGRAHELDAAAKTIWPHEIVEICNGLSHSKTSKIRRSADKVRKFSRAHGFHHQESLAHAQLEECHFEFRTLDEVDYVKNELVEHNSDFKGVLHVRVVEAEDLPPMDKDGNTDAYVTCSLQEKYDEAAKELQDGAKHTTVTVRKNLNPMWKDGFAFRLHQSTQAVRFAVIDHDAYNSDDLVSEFTIPIKDIMQKPKTIGEGEWFALDVVPKLGSHKSARIKLDISYAAPIDAEIELSQWAQRDIQDGFAKQRPVLWHFRASSVELKYGWVCALKWLQSACAAHPIGPPSALPPPTLHSTDARLVQNNVALLDLPFCRARHLLYNLYRFQCFGVKNSRDYLLYAMFQLEKYAWKFTTNAKAQIPQKLLRTRIGASAHIGVELDAVRGLDFHEVMMRLALIHPEYGKGQSLSYAAQMQEYSSEVRHVALHIIQAALAHWVFTFQANKAEGRFPTKIFWRRSQREVDTAKRKMEKLQSELEQAKLSDLRHRANELEVSEEVFMKSDDMIENGNVKEARQIIANAIFGVHKTRASQIGSGRTKPSFFIASRCVRNLRLSTLKRLMRLVKQNDPIVLHGDPEEAQRVHDAAVKDLEEAGMGPSDGLGCLDRRRLKKMQELAAEAMEKSLELTEMMGDKISEKVEAGVDSAMNTAVGKVVGDMAGMVTDMATQAIESSIQIAANPMEGVSHIVHEVEQMSEKAAHIVTDKLSDEASSDLSHDPDAAKAIEPDDSTRQTGATSKSKSMSMRKSKSKSKEVEKDFDGDVEVSNPVFETES